MYDSTLDEQAASGPSQHPVSRPRLEEIMAKRAGRQAGGTRQPDKLNRVRRVFQPPET